MSTPGVTKRLMRCAPWLVLSCLLGCPQTTDVVSSQLPDAGDMDAALDAAVDGAADAADAPDADDAAPDVPALGEGGVALCKGNKPCQCDNGEDDDGDGKFDGFDGECTGAYDDDERSLGTGMKEGNPHCADCFFSGKPNDKCKIATQCTVDGTSGGAAGCNTCTPGPECVTTCRPLTPNGCDCFGCCAIPFQGSIYNVRLTDTCTLEVLDQPSLCEPCKLSPVEDGCYNPCERCELCTGKTTLPPECGSYSCSNGHVCNESTQCPADEYCLQGCCVAYVY